MIGHQASFLVPDLDDQYVALWLRWMENKLLVPEWVHRVLCRVSGVLSAIHVSCARQLTGITLVRWV